VTTAITSRLVRRVSIRAMTNAAQTARHSTATIQNRAGTRIPSKPGSSARIAYGPGTPIVVPAIFGAGPSDSTHIRTAAAP
jgi:hypothetical protein